MIRKFSRKAFFKITGIAALGAFLSKFILLKNLNEINNKKINIKINPLAIKRNNKV